MKRIALTLCAVLLLTGCEETSAETTAPAENAAATEAIAAHDAQSERILSQEMAMLEGYVVMEDNDVRHNVGNWYKFLEQCQTGENAEVTVVQYTSGDGGSSCVRYDLTFDGTDYTVSFVENGRAATEIGQVLVIEDGLYCDTVEPYDRYEAYLLNDIVLYKDLIAEPDYEGVTEVFLHTKEGEPPIKTYSGADLEDILQLLMTAEYLPAEPEDYLYGMKLLMTNRDGKELVIELDLNYGYYRYGMQNYCYGEVEDMLAALGLEAWPEDVLEEFRDFLK